MAASLREHLRCLCSRLLAVLIALSVTACAGTSGFPGRECWPWGNGLSGLLVFFPAYMALVIAAPVALLFGAPLYALLVVKGVARWWSALLLAALRARVVAAPAPCIGGVAVWLGAITALLDHGQHSRIRLGRYSGNTSCRGSIAPWPSITFLNSARLTDT